MEKISQSTGISSQRILFQRQQTSIDSNMNSVSASQRHNHCHNKQEKRKKMSETILGFDANSIGASSFIVTNIKPLFDALIAAGSVKQDYWGFYHSVYIHLKGGSFVMTLLTPGNVIIDVLKLIANIATDVTLLGLCGSLNPNYPVATIVVPQFVTNSNDPMQKTVLNQNCNTGLCVCQVDGLVQTDNFYKQLEKVGVDFVDMESFFLKEQLPKMSLKTISVVSDMPLISPFYKFNPINIDIEAIISSL
ncbi:hypothetical protein [Prevotella sp. E13-27]|uniref:hypothetical protein n=1 Tax=Prevotella sp. E13-27 TaxID=2938122 RepID=UPI00200B50DD|nr:hypothetical protein [Prevotella sp. E13-27]MCK8621900.1 hypothetical protein [Prevotella sp. E13-27]